MKLILMISAFPLTIVIVGIAGIILYKKSLRQKGWFDGLALQFESTGCPHKKTIPYAETSGLSFRRRERRTEKTVFNKYVVTKEVTFRLRCEECGKKQNFHIIETPETKAYEKHRMIYIFGTFAAIFVIYGVAVAPILTFITKVFNL